MLANMLIRQKILYSTAFLTVTLLLLMCCSLQGVRSYRNLAINIHDLSHEIARVEDLKPEIDRLRDTISQSNASDTSDDALPLVIAQHPKLREYLAATSEQVEKTLKSFQRRKNDPAPLLRTTQEELEILQEMLVVLDEIKENSVDGYTFSFLGGSPQRISAQLGFLSQSLSNLSQFQRNRMIDFRSEVRARYHSWFGFIAITSFLSFVNVFITFWFFRTSIVKPFKVLLQGSRNIAAGEFEHRIEVESKDELAELSDAMNGMTARFLEIRENLNEKVRIRTQEVVRSEQLASVGFLAAGVAHEINNPLASIAWSAEALESRLHEVLHGSEHSDATPTGYDKEEIDILRDYLKRIQDEAFRCKSITERLLDFSRLGESSLKQETDIQEAIADVCELVKHLGQYRNRHLRFLSTPGIFAWVSPTEFKQVILNLITNALDASDEGGEVEIHLEADRSSFEVRVVDHGCGMTDEVMKHLFEPFFTRRRDGRGTGLGLSITYQIVQDHHGTLEPSSPGPDLGSTMTLTIPLHQPNVKDHERRQAA